MTSANDASFARRQRDWRRRKSQCRRRLLIVGGAAAGVVITATVISLKGANLATPGHDLG
jgi:hypothetical protein